MQHSTITSTRYHTCLRTFSLSLACFGGYLQRITTGHVVASIWDSFLAQASVLLLCQYAAALNRGEGPDLLLQSGPFQSFQKFFQELTWCQ